MDPVRELENVGAWHTAPKLRVNSEVDQLETPHLRRKRDRSQDPHSMWSGPAASQHASVGGAQNWMARSAPAPSSNPQSLDPLASPDGSGPKFFLAAAPPPSAQPAPRKDWHKHLEGAGLEGGEEAAAAASGAAEHAVCGGRAGSSFLGLASSLFGWTNTSVQWTNTTTPDPMLQTKKSQGDVTPRQPPPPPRAWLDCTLGGPFAWCS
eukprot:CAMPEP_0177695480 /NCGR_PEP_ID=MMETSP0484_2-20121128/3478_1 /TAXON_ID=354590 /ORGANISM="Rhodomonas lens, Strain RHODO" /LENGTH=207 /DNA_ID=CAMNT_0019206405 /DNA_START=273 /DNA_END=892 /DNA_ORIENTATION=-